MIAKKVNENISPSQITIDNIEQKTIPSEQAINNLEKIDIPRVAEKISSFGNKEMRIFGEESGIIEIQTPVKGMAYFIEI